MPIAINGSGTITGLSTGGLPDGSVDADTLASNAVTTVKINDDAVTDAKQSLSGAAKAWINFDGSAATIGTGRNHFNCSAVTDNGIGDYTINFATDMPNTSYVPVFTNIARNDTTVGFNHPGVRSVSNAASPNASLTVSGFRMVYRPTSTNLDSDMYGVVVFGD
jgi:hypothetical protein